MQNILISAAAAVIAFILLLLLTPNRIKSDAERRKRMVLGQVSQETMRSSALTAEPASVNLLKELPVGAGIFSRLPGVQSTVDLLLKAGMWQKRSTYLLASIVVFMLAWLLLQKIVLKFKVAASGSIVGVVIFVLALLISYWLPRKYLRKRIRKRNEQFLNLFPDTVDMIVRSVRSGHPLNTAMRMIVDNMENPVREEFKQVVDEVSYGRTLTEALSRMAIRIDEADLNFFVVVLSVQQETGGSLAEVLTNLSNIIRKRRQLRLKIRALTAEGRTTSYILGGLPVIQFIALSYFTPDYLDPLYETLAGNIMLAASASLIVGAVWIVRKMAEIDI